MSAAAKLAIPVRRPLAGRLIAAIIGFSSVIALVITATQLALEYQRDVGDIHARFHVIQEGYLRSIEENVWLVDAQRLDTLLRGITSLRDFEFAQVVAEGRVLASSGRPPGADSMERRYPLKYPYRGRMVDIGELAVAASLGEVRARAWERVGFILLANAAKTFLVALFIYFLVRRLIVRHVEALAERMRAVSTGQLSRGPLRIDRVSGDRKGEDEIDQLIGSFNDMGARLSTAIGNLEKLNEELETRVEARTGELLASNHGLRSALKTLQRAQDELVRNEKLVGLGSLVAGVAHELNTPLGNSLTVATGLAERSKEFARLFREEPLRRSSLEDFVRETSTAADLLTRNLWQASNLIGRFKQAAVDQTSAQRRTFELSRAVHEALVLIGPRFKTTPHRIEVDIAPGITMDSFPGPLGQIVTNLAMNALMHAFPGVAAGVFTIRGEALDDGRVRLVFADNGTGIAPEHLPRVFDPFFTTRLGKGGSGLGLHLVYGIATRVLGGRIEIASRPGEGTVFTLELPLRAPPA